MTTKQRYLALTLALALLCLCACARDNAPQTRDAKLITYFEGLGLECKRAPDVQVENPAIYKASAWYTLLVDGEAVYVYFDESNRANFLVDGIDAEKYGYATAFGLRFVLNYRGDNEKVLDALHGMSEVY